MAINFAAIDMLLTEDFNPAAMEKLLGIIISGEFEDPPEIAINKNDKVIGELSAYEKALYTAMSIAIDEENEDDYDYFYKMLFCSILKRSDFPQQDNIDFEIKENYQIVSVPMDEGDPWFQAK